VFHGGQEAHIPWREQRGGLLGFSHKTWSNVFGIFAVLFLVTKSLRQLALGLRLASKVESLSCAGLGQGRGQVQEPGTLLTVGPFANGGLKASLGFPHVKVVPSGATKTTKNQ
jgi:hypothetical protein